MEEKLHQAVREGNVEDAQEILRKNPHLNVATFSTKTQQQPKRQH